MTDTIPQAAKAGTVQLGSFRVNRIGYGAMRLTGEGVWGPPDVPVEAEAVLQHAVHDLGVNLIDTADAYGPHTNEQLIARTLKPFDDIVIATKGGMTRQGPGQWKPNGSPEHLRNACQASLRRLGVDSIDVYQLHAPDPDVPFEISLQTLIDLQHEGKIKHIGLSNVTTTQLEKALGMAEIVSVQNNYGLTNPEHEAVLKLCEQRGVVFIPYFPLGNGALTRPDGPLGPFADQHKVRPGQIALAWLLRHSEMILPIPGTASRGHLDENVAAATIELSEADMRELDALHAQA